MDIAVTSPLNDTNIRTKRPCEEYAKNRKHNKYDKDFKESESHLFGTIVWDARCSQQRGRELFAPNHALCLRAPEP